MLVVDDEAAVCYVTTKQLERLGQSATCTTSPLEALELIRTHPELYDLLITDLTMPEMTGMRLAESVHEVCPNLPIIMVSGNLDSRIDREQERAAGILEVLQKPMALQDMAQGLNRVFPGQKTETPAPEFPIGMAKPMDIPG